MNDPRAKAIYREILPGLEGILRDNNLSPTDTRNLNAAISETLHGLQKWNKCETVDRQILARTLGTLSRHDLTSLNAMDRLAAQHEFREAKVLYKEALDGFEEWVGSQHEIIRRCYKSFQDCSGMVQDDVERPRARSSSGESQESASSSDDGQYASSSDGDQAHKQDKQDVERSVRPLCLLARLGGRSGGSHAESLYFKCRTIKPEGTPSAIYGHSFMADLLWAV
ncbi:unnamed protein product [Aureobasidium pullulans]|nr:unnamed protein product [Aureobasidium pullulans]